MRENEPMDRNGRHSDRDAGTALIVGIITVMILAGLASALVTTNVTESGRKQAAIARTQVLYIAESGVKSATIDLERGGSGNLGSEDAPLSFGGGDYWVTATDNGDETFTVVSVGELRGARQAVEIVLAPVKESIFNQAMFGDLDLGASGTVFVDSYDSELGTYADQRTNWSDEASRLYASAKGSVGSNQNIQLRGGVVVLGNATPGPGYSVRISGANVYVDGSTTPAAKPTGLRSIEYNPPVATSSLSFSGEDPVLERRRLPRVGPEALEQVDAPHPGRRDALRGRRVQHLRAGRRPDRRGLVSQGLPRREQLQPDRAGDPEHDPGPEPADHLLDGEHGEGGRQLRAVRRDLRAERPYSAQRDLRDLRRDRRSADRRRGNRGISLR